MTDAEIEEIDRPEYRHTERDEKEKEGSEECGKDSKSSRQYGYSGDIRVGTSP